MAEAKPKISIVFYSLYGHVYRLAQEIQAGIEEAGGECQLFQVAETLPDEVLTKMHAPPKPDVPVVDVASLPEADGILFGIPTRFGMMAAQMKAFWDATGGHWGSGALVGKPAGLFFSTATLGGGQETTALTAITQLTHHGMIFVPIGYSEQSLTNLTEVHGGSPYGAGTLAGPDGSRQPSELELRVARHQGTHFTRVVRALKIGNAA